MDKQFQNIEKGEVFISVSTGNKPFVAICKPFKMTDNKDWYVLVENENTGERDSIVAKPDLMVKVY